MQKEIADLVDAEPLFSDDKRALVMQGAEVALTYDLERELERFVAYHRLQVRNNGSYSEEQLADAISEPVRLVRSWTGDSSPRSVTAVNELSTHEFLPWGYSSGNFDDINFLGAWLHWSGSVARKHEASFSESEQNLVAVQRVLSKYGYSLDIDGTDRSPYIESTAAFARFMETLGFVPGKKVEQRSVLPEYIDGVMGNLESPLRTLPSTERRQQIVADFLAMGLMLRSRHNASPDAYFRPMERRTEEIAALEKDGIDAMIEFVIGRESGWGSYVNQSSLTKNYRSDFKLPPSIVHDIASQNSKRVSMITDLRLAIS